MFAYSLPCVLYIIEFLAGCEGFYNMEGRVGNCKWMLVSKKWERKIRSCPLLRDSERFSRKGWHIINTEFANASSFWLEVRTPKEDPTSTRAAQHFQPHKME